VGGEGRGGGGEGKGGGEGGGGGGRTGELGINQQDQRVTIYSMSNVKYNKDIQTTHTFSILFS